jgi:hypothetical protein
MLNLLAQTTTTGPPPYPITVDLGWPAWFVVLFWAAIAFVVIALALGVVWTKRRSEVRS